MSAATQRPIPAPTAQRTSEVDASTDTEPDVVIGPDGFPVCDVGGATDALFVQGDYYVSLAVAPLGGLRVNMRANIVAADDRILQFELWSRSPDDAWESDAPVARACDVAVGEDGTFVIEMDSMRVPAQGTTTGVPVEVVDVRFEGEVLDSTNFCGAAYGYVGLLDFDLGGSSFRGVPLGTQSDPPLATCEVEEVREYAHIDACPTAGGGREHIHERGA